MGEREGSKGRQLATELWRLSLITRQVFLSFEIRLGYWFEGSDSQALLLI